MPHEVLSDRTLSAAPDCMSQLGCDSYAGCEHPPAADPRRGAQLRRRVMPWATGAARFSSDADNFSHRLRSFHRGVDLVSDVLPFGRLWSATFRMAQEVLALWSSRTFFQSTSSIRRPA